MDARNGITETPQSSCFFILGPPIALLSFAVIISGVVLTDLIVYRSCLVTLNLNDTKCSILRTNASSPEAMQLEAKVEPYASVIVMTKSLMESILPAVLSIFFGSWSDRGGRRPVFLSGFTGFAIMFITLALMCSWDISPWFLLIPSIPACLMGGQCTIILVSICHVTDMATEKNRIVLLAWFQASGFIGEILGGFIGPHIYENFGYASVFRIAAICCTLSLAYVYFCLPETVKNTSQEPKASALFTRVRNRQPALVAPLTFCDTCMGFCEPCERSIRGVFKASSLKELFTSVSVKRERFHSFIVLIAISTLTLNVMINKGNVTIEFLFTRARLTWNVQQFSYFDTTGIVLTMVGLCGVSLRNHVSDTLLAGMGFLSALGAAVTKSLTWESWHMYLAACIGIFSGIMPSVIRSIISKIVPSEDVGKVFSLATLLEVLSSLGGAPLYTFVYTNYLPPIYPSPVFLVSTTLFVILIVGVVCMHVMINNPRNPPDYTAASQDDRL